MGKITKSTIQGKAKILYNFYVYGRIIIFYVQVPSKYNMFSYKIGELLHEII